MIAAVALLLFQAGAGVGHTHTVEIRGMAFHPAVLDVAVGDTVVWINRDIVPHTATRAKGKVTWDTGQLTGDATGRYVATRRGTLRYTCTLHPTMQGELRVK